VALYFTLNFGVKSVIGLAPEGQENTLTYFVELLMPHKKILLQILNTKIKL
jgi:hypothetical protein